MKYEDTRDQSPGGSAPFWNRVYLHLIAKRRPFNRLPEIVTAEALRGHRKVQKVFGDYINENSKTVAKLLHHITNLEQQLVKATKRAEGDAETYASLDKMFRAERQTKEALMNEVRVYRRRYGALMDTPSAIPREWRSKEDVS